MGGQLGSSPAFAVKVNKYRHRENVNGFIAFRAMYLKRLMLGWRCSSTSKLLKRD